MTEKIRKMKHFFYKNPKTEVHLRELADKIDVSPGFVSKHINSLIEGDIIDEKREGNMRILFAHTSSDKYRRSKKAFNIREILNSELVPYLENTLYPDALVLFGSYLKGTDTEDSDIDIAVINGRENILDLSEYEEEFERKITLTHVSSKKMEPEFFEALANGLILSGHLELGSYA